MTRHLVPLLILASWLFPWISPASAAELGTPGRQPAGSDTIKVLVVGGRGHDWNGFYGTIAPVLQRTRDFKLTLTGNLDDLKFENISKYNVVLFYGSGGDFSDPRQEAGLEQFVKNGGGMTGVHATDAFKQSDVYWRLTGGRFVTHGGGQFWLRLDDRNHPITAGMQDFEISDETYTNHFHPDFKLHSLGRIDRGSEQQSMVWAQEYGQGRVFNTTLGHDGAAWTNPNFQRLLARGLYWAAGREPKMISLDSGERNAASASELRSVALSSSGVGLLGRSVEPGQVSVTSPTNLRCEYLKNPQGVGVSKPRFFWEDRSESRGFRQSAYQIELQRDGQTFWHTGKVSSDETIQIEYGGPALEPATRYSWRVRVWNQDDKVSAWSETAAFTTGLKEWQAQWIARRPEPEWRARYQASRDAEAKDPTRRFSRWEDHPRDPMDWITVHPKPIHDPAPLLRKEFAIRKVVRHATLYVTGLGHYQLFLNGDRADGGALAPGVTDYNKTVLYNAWDLTGRLKQGTNCLGLVLGRGWYNELIGSEPWGFSKAPWVAQPKAIAELHLLFEDGSRMIIPSDTSWKATDGPIVFDDMRFGEVYDATREIAGWSAAGLADTNWESAAVVPAPKGKLKAELMEAVTVNEEFRPTSVTPLPGNKSAWLFTFPQNIACQMRFRVDASAMRGKALKFGFYTYQEPDGRLTTPSGPTFSYHICSGKAVETIHLPQFGYAGGRYVTVEGLEKEPSPDDMVLMEVRSAVGDTGRFESSDPLLNRLQSNIRWSQANALQSYPQDCWTREKLGWTGDAHLTAEEAIFNFGMGAHYTKWMSDHLDVQGPDGGIAAFIPNYRPGNEGLTWSGTGIIIPWHLHTYYGDKRILEAMFESGEKYVAAAPTMGRKSDIFFGGPGEWCVPWAKTVDQIEGRKEEMAVPYSTFPGGGEGHYVYGTAYYCRLAGILEQMATVLGRTNKAQQWRERRERVTAAYNREFFNPKEKIYHGEHPTDYRQAANIIPLWFGMVPDDVRDAVIDNLLGDIVARHEGHLNTAVIGTQALFEELPRLGRTDLAYEIAMQKDYPGYLWPILEFGLTTLPEHWEGFGTHEHPFFGSVGAFFYKWLAGIQPDETAPGFKRFRIYPSIDNPLTFVKATYDSIRGPIRSEWRKSGSTLSLEVEVPANTEAEVEVPKFGYERPQITEGGKVIWERSKAVDRPGIRVAKDLPTAVRFRVASGTYQFKVDSQEPLAVARRAGIELIVSNATVYQGESAAIAVRATGNLSEAKLEVKSQSGLRVVSVEPKGQSGWAVTIAAPSSHREWRAEPLTVTLAGSADGHPIGMQKTVDVAVCAAVEVRYPQPLVRAAPGYEKPVTLFHLRSRRTEAANFSLDPKVPAGWAIEFLVDGRKIAAGEQVTLMPKKFTKVEAKLRAPTSVADGQRSPIEVAILQSNRQVGEFQGSVEAIRGEIIESSRDDFKTLRWNTEGELQLEAKGGRAEVFAPKGRVDAMTSDWMVMDCSKPLRVHVKTSSVQGEWCLQLDDGKKTHYLIGDTHKVGVKEGNFASLNLSGLQRFRLRFVAIARPGDCRIGLEEISITPKVEK